MLNLAGWGKLTVKLPLRIFVFSGTGVRQAPSLVAGTVVEVLYDQVSYKHVRYTDGRTGSVVCFRLRTVAPQPIEAWVQFGDLSELIESQTT